MNGQGKCDNTMCPEYTAYNASTHLCEPCQIIYIYAHGNIKDNGQGYRDAYGHCGNCDIHGGFTCNKDECPDRTAYSRNSRRCELCQINVGGHLGLNCVRCVKNGPGKCDPDGCEEEGVMHYNYITKMCEETLPITCRPKVYKYIIYIYININLVEILNLLTL